MYAIVEFKGVQLKVEKDMILRVPFLSKLEPGSAVEMPKVLLLDSGDDIKIGTPVLEGAKVLAEVIEHKRDKKVIVFKKKRRKGYVKKQGHRQNFTTVKIKDIVK